MPTGIMKPCEWLERRDSWCPHPGEGLKCRTNSQTLRNPRVTRGWMQNHPPTRGHPSASGLPSPVQHALPAAAFARVVKPLLPTSVLRQIC